MPESSARKGPLSGKTIAGCKLGERLGRGRTGNVYRAHCESIQGTAAVKILRGAEAQKPELREAFLREARAIAALDNENIVKIFDVLEPEGSVVIVMELLEGRNLWEHLQDGETFRAERAARIVLQVAKALAAAHRQKLVHRDIKPQNIILVGRDEVKVVDFGLAALPGKSGDRVGTPHYMSPEQGSRARVDSAADIYSLGATFYHMLTGQTPYQGKTVGEIIAAHKEGQLVPPKKVDAMIPVPLDRLVRQMMAPAKGYRPSADDVVKQLEEILAEGEWKRRRTQSRRGGPAGRREREDEEEGGRRPAGRHRARSRGGSGLLIAGFIGLVVILGVVLVLVITSKKSGEPEAPPVAQPPVEQPGPGTVSTAPEPVSDEERARIRAEKAEKALTAALAYVNNNRRDVAGGIRRLEAIADDYPNSSAARRAVKKATDMRMREEERKRRAERPKVDTEELKNRWELCRRLLARFRVEEADGKLKVLKADARYTPWVQKAKDEIEAKAHIEYLRDVLVHAVNNSNGYPFSVVETGKAGTIYAADTGGLSVRAGETTWRKNWEDMMGKQVLALADQCLPQNKAISFALGVYLIRAGLEQEARNQFDITRLTQRAGEYNEKIERLGK